ncbi:hypothetical protein [Streptomyces sp. NPDC127098]|uniref:hypothetical protein n=1 Tax=Streptomyces sp. NPDC127098 TaxID=3347137 RepID=UPI00364E2BF2
MSTTVARSRSLRHGAIRGAVLLTVVLASTAGACGNRDCDAAAVPDDGDIQVAAAPERTSGGSGGGGRGSGSRGRTGGSYGSSSGGSSDDCD